MGKNVILIDFNEFPGYRNCLIDASAIDRKINHISNTFDDIAVTGFIGETEIALHFLG